MSTEQLNLFETGAVIGRAYLHGQLAEAKTDSERKRIKTELEALADKPKPGAFWNGKIWVSDADVDF